MRDDVAAIVTLLGVAACILGDGRESPTVSIVGFVLSLIGAVLLIAGALRGTP